MNSTPKTQKRQNIALSAEGDSASIHAPHGPLRLWLAREGWIYLVILVFVSAGALLRNINLLMLMTGIMIAPIFVSWRLCLAMLRKTWARRVIPSQVFAGQPTSISWQISNRRRVVPSWHLVVQDQLTRPELKRDRPARVRVVIPMVRAGETEYATYQANFPSRGEVTIGPAYVATRFPCGLIEGYFRLPEQITFRVAPALGRLTASWDRRLFSHATGQQAIRRRRGIQDDEFFGLRQWRSGDNRRHIHWRATAKHNQPVVKQFDSKSDRDFVMALDLWVPECDPSSTSQAVETALSFGATVMTGLSGKVRGKVALAICGRGMILLSDVCGPKYFATVWDELAVATASPSPDLVGGLKGLADQVPGGTPFYVISTRPHGEFERSAGRSFVEIQPWAAIEPWVRWLQVGTPEFAELFENSNDGTNSMEPSKTEVRNAG